jgi:hypothetical protein
VSEVWAEEHAAAASTLLLLFLIFFFPTGGGEQPKTACRGGAGSTLPVVETQKFVGVLLTRTTTTTKKNEKLKCGNGLGLLLSLFRGPKKPLKLLGRIDQRDGNPVTKISALGCDEHRPERG